MTPDERLAEAARRIEDYASVDSNGCWILDVGRFGPGYNRIMVDWEKDLAQRWSYRAFKGPIPEDKLVRHTCDVPPCANPDHLILGTQSENIQDCVSRGRHVKNRGGAKLTWEQAEEIRASTEPKAVLCERYGVSRATIYNAQYERTWVSSSKET